MFYTLAKCLSLFSRKECYFLPEPEAKRFQPCLSVSGKDGETLWHEIRLQWCMAYGEGHENAEKQPSGHEERSHWGVIRCKIRQVAMTESVSDGLNSCGCLLLVLVLTSGSPENTWIGLAKCCLRDSSLVKSESARSNAVLKIVFVVNKGKLLTINKSY